MSIVASDNEKQLLLQIIKKLDAIEQKLDEVIYPPEEFIKEEFIKKVEKAEKRVKEGKAKKYTLGEFKKKFAP